MPPAWVGWWWESFVTHFKEYKHDWGFIVTYYSPRHQLSRNTVQRETITHIVLGCLRFIQLCFLGLVLVLHWGKQQSRHEPFINNDNLFTCSHYYHLATTHYHRVSSFHYTGGYRTMSFPPPKKQWISHFSRERRPGIVGHTERHRETIIRRPFQFPNVIVWLLDWSFYI